MAKCRGGVGVRAVLKTAKVPVLYQNKIFYCEISLQSSPPGGRMVRWCWVNFQC